jgi:putative acetyltransferase
MSEIVTRQLLKSEIKPAVKIWLDASKKAHHFIDPAYWKSKVEEMENQWLPSAKNTALINGERLIGFSSVVDSRLAAIFINPNEQGNGYGTLLLNEAKQCRKRLELTVYEKNRNAVKFYEKHGFRNTENRKDPATGEYEYVMVWTG